MSPVAALATLSAETTERLQAKIRAMTLDNFLVRPKRKFVEKYAEPQPWETWNLTTRTELCGELAGLPTTLTDDDVDAKEREKARDRHHRLCRRNRPG